LNDQSLDIEVEHDQFGVTHRVWVTLAGDGSLSLNGHDMGTAVSESWGDEFDEYEWSWTLDPSRVPALLNPLQLNGQSKDWPVELAVRLRAIGTTEAESKFKDAGAEFWSRVGD
jgi:hypothetical protein